MVASVKGIEPKMKIIEPSNASQAHQPGASAASASIGTCGQHNRQPQSA